MSEFLLKNGFLHMTNGAHHSGHEAYSVALKSIDCISYGHTRMKLLICGEWFVCDGCTEHDFLAIRDQWTKERSG